MRGPLYAGPGAHTLPGMLPHSTRLPALPAELMARVLELLGENTRESRLAAAQILAHGYELDEAERRAGLHPDDVPRDLHELEQDE